MRLLVLSIGTFILVLGVAWSQSPADGKNTFQIPYGQTDKDFHYPYFDKDDGQLKFTLSMATATGKSANRAEATNLKIELYEQGKATTTITSPKADLYPTDQRMRTKNTVLIVRDDMNITAQNCDFDRINKKYFLNGNVKVVLKKFTINLNSPSGSPSPAPSTGTTPTPTGRTAPTPPSLTPSSSSSHDNSLLDTPGAYANSNLAPASPPSPANP